jgi:hypothetical protein
MPSIHSFHRTFPNSGDIDSTSTSTSTSAITRCQPPDTWYSSFHVCSQRKPKVAARQHDNNQQLSKQQLVGPRDCRPAVCRGQGRHGRWRLGDGRRKRKCGPWGL